jgi:hypothetical protein
MVCIACCYKFAVFRVKELYFNMEDHSEMRNDGEMEKEGSIDDYACICCSGAYESFDSITSVLEAKEKVNITKKITEKVVKQRALSKERIERQNRKAELKASLERTPQEKLMDAYFEKLEAEIEENKSCPIMIKSPCELLKSGSATCQCTECRGEHSDDSVHSEDCLDLLTTTHV